MLGITRPIAAKRFWLAIRVSKSLAETILRTLTRLGAIRRRSAIYDPMTADVKEVGLTRHEINE